MPPHVSESSDGAAAERARKAERHALYAPQEYEETAARANFGRRLFCAPRPGSVGEIRRGAARPKRRRLARRAGVRARRAVHAADDGRVGAQAGAQDPAERTAQDAAPAAAADGGVFVAGADGAAVSVSDRGRRPPVGRRPHRGADDGGGCFCRTGSSISVFCDVLRAPPRITVAAVLDAATLAAGVAGTRLPDPAPATPGIPPRLSSQSTGVKTCKAPAPFAARKHRASSRGRRTAPCTACDRREPRRAGAPEHPEHWPPDYVLLDHVLWD
mmetsp:Transcript_28727/g.98926  ORF Transcript_28727/g.98926 Transcript_28727/m.98926 type:complete len:272 (+) Transcript_28727:527-1342(+)